MNKKAIDALFGGLYSATILGFLFWIIFPNPTIVNVTLLIIVIVIEVVLYRWVVEKTSEQ